MKLSEAIRLGQFLGPQRGLSPRWGPENGLCAVEGALLAIGRRKDQLGLSHSKEYFPLLMEPVAKCPRCLGCGHVNVAYTVECCLNDSGRWPRERIADWVETIEAQQEAPVESVEESHAV